VASEGNANEGPSAEPLELSALRDRLVAMHGEMVSESALAELLGYPSLPALRQACKRNLAPVPIFTPAGRRGKFALTLDIAAWMYRCRTRAAVQKPP
jgi:hypothetical protein